MEGHPLDIDVLRDTEWQMRLGERCALDGLLRNLAPALSVEIGRAEGGSLRRIAAHSQTVHSFDLVAPHPALPEQLGNVTFHTGDAADQVPATLSALAAAARHVDFALVDGDHSAGGVRRDAEALLASPACATTAIVFHDAANEEVRAGLEAVGFADHPKVALALLDFVPGYLVEHGPFSGQIWNGLGLVVLGGAHGGAPAAERDLYDAAAVVRAGRAALQAPAPEPFPTARRRVGGVALAALATGAALGALAGRFSPRRRPSW